MKTFAFIDASNLFYGGEKSLGWKIDYQKLLVYLREKYKITKAFILAELNFMILNMIIKTMIPCRLKNWKNILLIS